MKKPIIVFGCGEYYKYKKKSIDDSYDVIAYVDNSSSKDGVNSPDVIDSLTKDASILITTARNSFINIAKQLIEMGVSEDRIEFAHNIEPAFDAAEKYIQAHNGYVGMKSGKLFVSFDGRNYIFSDLEEYTDIFFTVLGEEDTFLQAVKCMPIQPISGKFGRERGTPIDRYYIEKFLEDNKQYISGKVAEIAENTYTKRFGGNDTESLIFHVVDKKGTKKVDFASGEGVEEEIVNCLICTQTIQFIYDVESAVNNIHKVLTNGGTALISAHGISQISMGDYKNWGEYWRFTEKSFRNLLETKFRPENIEIICYGNVKAAIAFLYGACVEDMDKKELDFYDEQYPLVICACCRKE